MSNWNSKPVDLVGKVIAGVVVGLDRETLTIEFKDGTRAHGVVDGDCCSTSWIEDVELPSDYEGATVLAYRVSEDVPADIDVPYVDEENLAVTARGNHGPQYVDHVQHYQELIDTSAGTISIEFRNSSNGYYGGSLEWELLAT